MVFLQRDYTQQRQIIRVGTPGNSGDGHFPVNCPQGYCHSLVHTMLGMDCCPALDHPRMELSGFGQGDGLVAPPGFIMSCPLPNGPSFRLTWAMQEDWNGE